MKKSHGFPNKSHEKSHGNRVLKLCRTTNIFMEERPMKSIIEGMYFGTLHPFGEVHTKSAKRTETVQKLLSAEREIKEQCPECSEALEKYLAEYAEFESVRAYEQFQRGFRAGAQLMLEMLRPTE